MDKTIKGTKDRKRFQVIKGSSDTREIRCNKCRGVAKQVPDGKGGFVCKCQICGTSFTFARM